MAPGMSSRRTVGRRYSMRNGATLPPRMAALQHAKRRHNTRGAGTPEAHKLPAGMTGLLPVAPASLPAGSDHGARDVYPPHGGAVPRHALPFTDKPPKIARPHPGPVCQSCPFGIRENILSTTLKFSSIPDNVVVVLTLPEGALPAQDAISPLGSKGLPGMKYRRQEMPLQRGYKHMDMVRHNTPRPENIATPGKLFKCLGQDLRCLRVTKPAGVDSGVEGLLDPPAALAGEPRHRAAPAREIVSQRHLRLLSFLSKSRERGRRQTSAQAERNEVDCPVALDVRKSTPAADCGVAIHCSMLCSGLAWATDGTAHVAPARPSFQPARPGSCP